VLVTANSIVETETRLRQPDRRQHFDDDTLVLAALDRGPSPSALAASSIMAPSIQARTSSTR
jgi:hypothetical protein